MAKIAVVGAGKTGRGFLGRLLQEAQQQMLFIDKDALLVEKLNQQKHFTVHFFGEVRQPLQVSCYQAHTWETASLQDVQLILVSVGGQNLKDVGAALRERLDPQQHYYIITAENASHPSKTLREAIGMDNVSVSEATVFCTTIEKDGLDIHSENYPYLQCDADLLDGYIPTAQQIRPVGQFSNFLTRKLYTYNAASCVIAYNGWILGYTNYGEAANDPRILAMLDENYLQTNRVLCMEYGYSPEDQAEFAQLSKNKFCDKTIVDTIARNARDPQRKLAAGERIMGPMRLIYSHGGDCTVLERTCAAAVLYYMAEDESQTAEGILQQICGLEPQEPLYQNVLGHIRAMA